jgi:hypothetical protein
LSEQGDEKIIIIGEVGAKNQYCRGEVREKSSLPFFYQEEGIWTNASNAYV